VHAICSHGAEVRSQRVIRFALRSYPHSVEAKVTGVTDGAIDWRASKLAASTVVQRIPAPASRAGDMRDAAQALLLRHGIEVPEDCSIWLEARRPLLSCHTCRVLALCML
jgi:hypothetical protein